MSSAATHAWSTLDQEFARWVTPLVAPALPGRHDVVVGDTRATDIPARSCALVELAEALETLRDALACAAPTCADTEPAMRAALLPVYRWCIRVSREIHALHHGASDDIEPWRLLGVFAPYALAFFEQIAASGLAHAAPTPELATVRRAADRVLQGFVRALPGAPHSPTPRRIENVDMPLAERAG